MSGLAAIWLVTVWLLPTPDFTGDDTAAAIADLARRPLVSAIGLVLTNGVAPSLLWIAATPIVMRVPSRDARSAIFFSGASAYVMSLVQLCIGLWLTLGGPSQQIAAFAGARTLNDLAGATAILLAVATATVLLNGPCRHDRPTPRSALLLAASVASATAGIGHIVENETIASSSGLLTLPLVVSVVVCARTAPRGRSGFDPTNRRDHTPHAGG